MSTFFYRREEALFFSAMCNVTPDINVLKRIDAIVYRRLSINQEQ